MTFFKTVTRLGLLPFIFAVFLMWLLNLTVGGGSAAKKEDIFSLKNWERMDLSHDFRKVSSYKDTP